MPAGHAIVLGLINALPCPALLFDTEGLVVYVSDSLARLAGRPPAELEGEPVGEVCHLAADAVPGQPALALLRSVQQARGVRVEIRPLPSIDSAAAGPWSLLLVTSVAERPGDSTAATP